MKNVKGYAIASDGNMKRIAITYDEIDDTGKVIRANIKTNRLISDTDVLSANKIIENFANLVIENI